MSPSYKQNKKHIYKFKEANPSYNNIYVYRSLKWKKIQKVFFNILL